MAKRNNARLGLVARGHSRPRARIVTLQPHRATPLCCGHVWPRGKFAATPTGAEQAETSRGRPGERARRYPAGPGRCRPEVTGAQLHLLGGARGAGRRPPESRRSRRWCCSSRAMEPPPLVLLVGLALLGAAGGRREGPGTGEAPGCRWKGRREEKQLGLRWAERKGGGGEVGGFSRPSAGPRGCCRAFPARGVAA